MSSYAVQEYTPQFWQSVISFVIGLAVLAMIVAEAIKAVKEALKS